MKFLSHFIYLAFVPYERLHLTKNNLENYTGKVQAFHDFWMSFRNDSLESSTKYLSVLLYATQKMKFPIEDFLRKCEKTAGNCRFGHIY